MSSLENLREIFGDLELMGRISPESVSAVRTSSPASIRGGESPAGDLTEELRELRHEMGRLDEERSDPAHERCDITDDSPGD